MLKKQIRKEYMERRKMLSSSQVEQLSKQLVSQFNQLNLSDRKLMHVFLPIKAKNEPDTYRIVSAMKAVNSKMKYVVSKTHFSTRKMEHFFWNENTVLEESSFGILEPIEGELVSVEDIDIVLLPLLAFDKKGYRVGYGKGIYDAMLSECSPKALFVGLSFFDPVEIIEDLDEWDKKMTMCITPQKTYFFE